MTTSQQSSRKPFKVSGTPFQLASKRLLDIIISAICLVIISPVLLIIAAGIMLEDGRPVFFKQRRSGRCDTVFHIYKFRSMKQNNTPTAREMTDDGSWINGVPDDFVFKSAQHDNPNITRIGRFLRKSSLDELPQFMNVLKGDMSLVGPRPEITDVTYYYNDKQRQRLAVKPGITGWAQINSRRMTHGEKIRHDLEYVNHFSLTNDFKIICKTFSRVIRGSDAV